MIANIMMVEFVPTKCFTSLCAVRRRLEMRRERRVGCGVSENEIGRLGDWGRVGWEESETKSSMKSQAEKQIIGRAFCAKIWSKAVENDRRDKDAG